MAITESRIRRIIREEARRVMSEQGTAQQAGASIDAGVKQAGANIASGVSTAGAHLSARATPQQIDQTAVGITDALLTSPILAVLRITPNGRETLMQAVKTTITARQSLIPKLLDAAVVPRVIGIINEMVTSGQIQGIVTRLMGQNKGYAEIAGAVIDAAVARLG